ncbi:putative F-box protein At1g32420 [Papaver somniferum]|uniref:putative F-box protein At1g32420 n=1 Tax=Papaver somniferum TaxID=3469 RepID=UPI000E6F4846|nr:putative F-box protein At1g32420 [Papaver somniferum]
MKRYGDTSKFPSLMPHRVMGNELLSKSPPLTSCTSHPIVGNELLLCEILTRVPVKPLMRFKCVCKQWYSLIHTYRSFIDLHFARSKSCNVAGGDGSVSLFRFSYQLRVFSSVELLLSQGRVKDVEREISVPGSSLVHVFGAINGLISVIETSTCSVRVFNPSTGQSTPWVKSMIKQQSENPPEELAIDEDGDYATYKVTYGLGP